MSESVYKVIETIGTSTESWEKAAAAAVETAAKSLRDLRIAEVVQLDMHIEDGRSAPTPAQGSGVLSSTTPKQTEPVLVWDIALSSLPVSSAIEN